MPQWLFKPGGRQWSSLAAVEFPNSRRYNRNQKAGPRLSWKSGMGWYRQLTIDLWIVAS